MLAQHNESRWKQLLQELETLRAEKDRETARLAQTAQRLEQRIESLTTSRAADQSEMHGVYRSAFEQQAPAASAMPPPSRYDGYYAGSTAGSSVAGSVRSSVDGHRYGGSPARSVASSMDVDSSLRAGYGAGTATGPTSSYRAITPEVMEGMPPERPGRRTRASPGSTRSGASTSTTKGWTPASERAPASLRVPDVDADTSWRSRRYE
jgi:hypothetical protein